MVQVACGVDHSVVLTVWCWLCTVTRLREVHSMTALTPVTGSRRRIHLGFHHPVPWPERSLSELNQLKTALTSNTRLIFRFFAAAGSLRTPFFAKSTQNPVAIGADEVLHAHHTGHAVYSCMQGTKPVIFHEFSRKGLFVHTLDRPRGCMWL